MGRWAEGEQMGPHEQATAQVFTDIIGLDYDEDVAVYYEKESSDEK